MVYIDVIECFFIWISHQAPHPREKPLSFREAKAIAQESQRPSPKTQFSLAKMQKWVALPKFSDFCGTKMVENGRGNGVLSPQRDRRRLGRGSRSLAFHPHGQMGPGADFHRFPGSVWNILKSKVSQTLEDCFETFWLRFGKKHFSYLRFERRLKYWKIFCRFFKATGLADLYAFHGHRERLLRTLALCDSVAQLVPRLLGVFGERWSTFSVGALSKVNFVLKTRSDFQTAKR